VIISLDCKQGGYHPKFPFLKKKQRLYLSSFSPFPDRVDVVRQLFKPQVLGLLRADIWFSLAILRVDAPFAISLARLVLYFGLVRGLNH
jgi:hypothetical protein